MIDRRCPNPECRDEIARPAREGGFFYKSRYTRRTPAGALVIACRGCGHEIALTPDAPGAAPRVVGRLVFPRVRAAVTIVE